MTLVRELADAIGSANVLTDPDSLVGFRTDWTRRFSGLALAVCRPASAEEVARILRICSAHGTPVVPQGGNTGLVGGSVPGEEQAVILSTTRLTDASPVDAVGREVIVGAGVTIAALQQTAASAGLSYGVDLASRDSATVGGTIATDAGGVRVCAYGTTRAQVLGLQAVLADGSIIDRLTGPRKDSGGYDLSQLLTASEGTLGVITAARLRLVEPLPAGRITALVGVRDLTHALALLQRGLLAAEWVESSVMALTGGPTSAAGWLLLEGLDLDLPDDAMVAIDHADRARLWSWREAATDAVATLGVPTKLDVALPLQTIAEFRAELSDVVGSNTAYVWGHLAEGNLHVNVIGPEPSESLTERVLRLVAAHHGSVSSEHGIGRAKREWLHLTRSSAELAAMARVKWALDPTGLLNPGVLVDARDGAPRTTQ